MMATLAAHPGLEQFVTPFFMAKSGPGARDGCVEQRSCSMTEVGQGLLCGADTLVRQASATTLSPSGQACPLHMANLNLIKLFHRCGWDGLDGKRPGHPHA